MPTASGRTRSRPVKAIKKAADGGPFPGLGAIPQQAFCMSVYAHALIGKIVLNGIGIPAAHDSSGMRQVKSHAGAVMRNDRNPCPGVQAEMIQAPSTPRPLSEILRPFLSLPALPTNSVLPLAVAGKYGLRNVSAGHKRACCFLFCGAQLYLTTLLQVMPTNSQDLRKPAFHAGLRGLPMKRFATL